MEFQEAARARFAELRAKHAEARAVVAPIEAERDALAEEEARMRERIGELRHRRLAAYASTGISEIEREMAMIARALDGKT